MRLCTDPLGRRIERAAAGITTKYLYDGQNILRRTQTDATGTQVLTYIQGPGLDDPLAKEDNSGALVYYHADALGSILATTSQAGSVVSTRRYDAWGNLEAGASESDYAFTGREWDPETGLYYYRARYYSPQMGRFLSEDPRRFQEGPNLYAYVRANPTTFVDPSGTSFWAKGYRAVQLIKGRLPRLAGSLTEAQAIARRSRGRDVAVIAETAEAAVHGGKELEVAANARRGEQIFHDTDAHKFSGNQPHWQTKGVKGHTFLKTIGGVLVSVFAENAIATAEAGANDPCITTTDVAINGAWDIAKSIDPVFVTDLIEYMFLQ
jgi:RHS repeat-associated protein